MCISVGAADGLLPGGLARGGEPEMRRADSFAFLGCLLGRRDFELFLAGDLRVERIVFL
jgi:hypothetical protein